jgi:hypothetical protein
MIMTVPTPRTAPTVLRLRPDVAWHAEVGRLYVCHSRSLGETGLPTQGLPPALISLMLMQLRVGTTHRDLLFLLGRAHHRRARRLLGELERQGLVETYAPTYEPGPAVDRLQVRWHDVPVALPWPRRCRVLVQSGSADRHPLPATLAGRLAPEVHVHDLALGGGQLVLARRHDSDACMACLLLWFFGSRLLPLSYLSACLNASEDVADAATRERHVEAALTLLRTHPSAIAFAGHADRDPAHEPVMVRPPGRHPACACAAFGARATRGAWSSLRDDGLSALAADAA